MYIVSSCSLAVVGDHSGIVCRVFATTGHDVHVAERLFNDSAGMSSDSVRECPFVSFVLRVSFSVLSQGISSMLVSVL